MAVKKDNLGITALLILAGVLLLLHSCASSLIPQSQTNLNPKQADPALLQMLTDELERQLVALPPKYTSGPPMTIASQTVLSLSNNTQLDWGYYSQGDYDQNGEVNVSDLTPLAIHFQESVAPATFAPNSIQAVIDGDGNGEINLADVTPIAINFQNTVTAYNVYRSLDMSDYPGDDPASGNGQAERILQIPLTSAVGDSALTRLAFSAELAEQREGDWLWLRPEDTGTEGIASNIVGPVVHPGFTIRGRIVDPHSTVPSLEGVEVGLSGTEFAALTDSGGNFEFRGVQGGDYTVLPYSFELYFEPAQVETTVGTEDIDVADISAFNINTAHTYGFSNDRISLDVDVNSANEVLLVGYENHFPNEGDITIIKYGPAHELAWAKTWDSGSPDNYPSVAFLDDGSFLMACQSELTLLEEEQRFFSVVKFNSNGDLIWQRKWGSLDREVGSREPQIEPASDGDFFIFHYLHLGDRSTDSDPLLIKLSPSGVVRWQQTLHLPGNSDGSVAGGVAGPDGGIYITIGGGSEALLGNTWLAKIDAEGNIIWAKRWSEDNEYLLDLDKMPSGNLLLTGFPQQSGVPATAMLVEVTPEGNLVSARKWEAGIPAWLRGCAVTPAGGIVCMGIVDFGYPLLRPLLFYINPDGELGWSTMWVSEHRTTNSQMILDGNNNVILSGSGENNTGYWVPIDGSLETVEGALEDITLETDVPDCSMSNTSGTMSPVDGVEDVGSGNRDMLLIWRHIEE